MSFREQYLLLHGNSAMALESHMATDVEVGSTPPSDRATTAGAARSHVFLATRGHHRPRGVSLERRLRMCVAIQALAPRWAKMCTSFETFR